MKEGVDVDMMRPRTHPYIYHRRYPVMKFTAVASVSRTGLLPEGRRKIDSRQTGETCAWNPTSADPSAREISRASVTVRCDAHERGLPNRVWARKVLQIT
jgi:hypothetical protein